MVMAAYMELASAFAHHSFGWGYVFVLTSVQVVVPHMTASYADGPKDQEDDAIPMCTLRNFPSLIEHCIEWAR